MERKELSEIQKLASKITEQGTARDEIFITFNIKTPPLMRIGIKEDLIYIKDDSRSGQMRPVRFNIFKKAALYWLYHKVFK